MAIFGDRRLEDLWFPCRLVTTDITNATRYVLTEGPVWRATLASASPPGLTVPVVLEDGRLLCDGGVVDNLPINELLRDEVGTIIASSVSSEDRPQLKVSGGLAAIPGGAPGKGDAHGHQHPAADPDDQQLRARPGAPLAAAARRPGSSWRS